jgi:hypothetical protein
LAHGITTIEFDLSQVGPAFSLWIDWPATRPIEKLRSGVRFVCIPCDFVKARSTAGIFLQALLEIEWAILGASAAATGRSACTTWQSLVGETVGLKGARLARIAFSD